MWASHFGRIGNKLSKSSWLTAEVQVSQNVGLPHTWFPNLVNYCLSIIGNQLLVMKYRLLVMHHLLLIISQQLLVNSYQLSVKLLSDYDPSLGFEHIYIVRFG